MPGRLTKTEIAQLVDKEGGTGSVPVVLLHRIELKFSDSNDLQSSNIHLLSDVVLKHKAEEIALSESRFQALDNWFQRMKRKGDKEELCLLFAQQFATTMMYDFNGLEIALAEFERTGVQSILILSSTNWFSGYPKAGNLSSNAAMYRNSVKLTLSFLKWKVVQQAVKWPCPMRILELIFRNLAYISFMKAKRKLAAKRNRDGGIGTSRSAGKTFTAPSQVKLLFSGRNRDLHGKVMENFSEACRNLPVEDQPDIICDEGFLLTTKNGAVLEIPTLLPFQVGILFSIRKFTSSYNIQKSFRELVLSHVKEVHCTASQVLLTKMVEDPSCWIVNLFETRLLVERLLTAGTPGKIDTYFVLPMFSPLGRSATIVRHLGGARVVSTNVHSVAPHRRSVPICWPVDTMFCYGEAMRIALTHVGFSPGQLIDTGNLSLSETNEIASTKEKKIVVATSGLAKDELHWMKHLAETAKNKKWSVAFSFHQSVRQKCRSDKILKAFFAENHILTESDLLDAIAESSLVITDDSSAGALAIHYKKPLIVANFENLKLNVHDFVVRKTAVEASNIEALISLVDEVVENGMPGSVIKGRIDFQKDFDLRPEGNRQAAALKHLTAMANGLNKTR